MRHSIYLLVPLLSIASTAYGEVFSASNSGMGGVGVASSKLDSAAYNNPALLTRPNGSKNTVITIPSLGVEASDKDDVMDTVDDIQVLFDDFEADVQALADNPTPSNQARAEQSFDEVISTLKAIDDKPITARGSALLSIATRFDNWAFALESRQSFIGNSRLKFDSEDENLLQRAVDNADPSLINDIETKVNASGVVLNETVLSIAKNITVKGQDLAVGISPKLVEVDTYFYSQGADNFDRDNLDINDYRKSNSAVNIDVGLAYFLSDSVTAGIIFRDLMSQEFTTVTENDESDEYQTKLSSTLGIALSKPFYSVALDVDLIPKSGFKSVKESHFVRVGAELDAWGWAQFRAGARVDLNAERENVITGGINLSPYNTVHLGLSGFSGGNNTAGVAADFKILF